MTPTVRDPSAPDEAAWRTLWAGYCAFYEAAVPEDATAETWRRILDPAAPVFARLAVSDNRVQGFAVCVLHDGSWSARPVCYLEDLFVAPAARGGGLARALIEDVLHTARQRSWAKVYWHTKADNGIARRLYDRFATADGFVRYVVSTS